MSKNQIALSKKARKQQENLQDRKELLANAIESLCLNLSPKELNQNLRTLFQDWNASEFASDTECRTDITETVMGLMGVLNAIDYEAKDLRFMLDDLSHPKTNHHAVS